MSNRNSITPGHTFPYPGQSLVVRPAPNGGFAVSLGPTFYGETVEPIAAFSTPEEAGAYVTQYLIRSTLARMERNVDARS